MKKCSPGIICIETTTMLFTILIILGILGLIYVSVFTTSSDQPAAEQVTSVATPAPFFLPSWPYNNLVNYFRRPRDIIRNPYVPPLRNERYGVYMGNQTIRRPIEMYPISTSIGGIANASYRQVGMLTPLNQTSENNILSLLGRPVHTSRDKWQYYSISNQQNSIKLPISINGRSALTEYGVDRLSSGDTVYVEGVNQPHTVTTYDNETIQYMPYV